MYSSELRATSDRREPTEVRRRISETRGPHDFDRDSRDATAAAGGTRLLGNVERRACVLGFAEAVDACWLNGDCAAALCRLVFTRGSPAAAAEAGMRQVVIAAGGGA